jgi:hypothetical protein
MMDSLRYSPPLTVFIEASFGLCYNQHITQFPLICDCSGRPAAEGWGGGVAASLPHHPPVLSQAEQLR